MPSQAPNASEYVIDRVNRFFPDYGGPVISPPEMLRTGRANCFGRLATIGAGLIDVGVGEDKVHWLINLGHGAKFYSRAKKRELEWFGHVELTVDHEGGYLVDALYYAWHESVDTVSWNPADPAPLFVIDSQKQQSGRDGSYMDIKGLRILKDLPEILALGPYFTVHPFSEGIEFYQANHARLYALTTRLNS